MKDKPGFWWAVASALTLVGLSVYPAISQSQFVPPGGRFEFLGGGGLLTVLLAVGIFRGWRVARWIVIAMLLFSEVWFFGVVWPMLDGPFRIAFLLHAGVADALLLMLLYAAPIRSYFSADVA